MTNERLESRPESAKGVSYTKVTPKLLKDASGEKVLEKAVVLDLHARNILRLEDMDKVPNTRSLDLSFNHISTVHGLEHLKQLKELKLYNNQLGATELTPLMGLRTLTTLQNLELQSNQLEALTGMDTLKGLKFLRVDGNPLASMADAKGLLALESLNLSRCKLEKIEGLGGLTALQELDLSGNGIRVIEGIGRCTALLELSLSDNPVSKISGLSKLTRLDVLRLERIGLPSLNVLPDSLPFLTELFVAGNGIVSLAPLAACPGLQTLDCSDNRISSVKQACAALAQLPELQELRVAGNPMVANLKAGGGAGFHARLADAAPALKFLDEEPFSGPAAAGGAGGADQFAPSADEMGEYMKKMGIRTRIDPGARPATPRGDVMGPRPGTASSSRPSTPGGGRHTPLMHQRPGSARGRPGVRLMAPEEYKESVDKFTADIQGYLSTMEDVIGSLRRDLAMPREMLAAEIVRGGGKSVTKDMPSLPTVPNPPNFPVVDAEEAAEREAEVEARRKGAAAARKKAEKAKKAEEGAAGPRPGSRGGGGALGVFEKLLGAAPSAALAEALAEGGGGWEDDSRPGTAASGWSEASQEFWDGGGGGGGSGGGAAEDLSFPPLPAAAAAAVPPPPGLGVAPGADFGWGALLDYDVGTARHVLDGGGEAGEDDIRPLSARGQPSSRPGSAAAAMAAMARGEAGGTRRAGGAPRAAAGGGGRAGKPRLLSGRAGLAGGGGGDAPPRSVVDPHLGGRGAGGAEAVPAPAAAVPGRTGPRPGSGRGRKVSGRAGARGGAGAGAGAGGAAQQPRAVFKPKTLNAAAAL